MSVLITVRYRTGFAQFDRILSWGFGKIHGSVAEFPQKLANAKRSRHSDGACSEISVVDHILSHPFIPILQMTTSTMVNKSTPEIAYNLFISGTLPTTSQSAQFF
jgi:hypothetical protein